MFRKLIRRSKDKSQSKSATKTLPACSSGPATDEDEFVELMDKYDTETNADKKKRLEKQILEFVDRHFRAALKPLMIRKFGSKVVSAKDDAAVRFTTMVNEFFVKVLEKRHDEFWKARSLPRMRNWAATVMTNQMYDFQRRERRYEKHEPDDLEELAPLYQDVAACFEAEHQFQLDERVLEQIQRWEESGTADERRMATALRLRHVFGMKPNQIAPDLKVPVSSVYRLLENGIARLRTKFAST